MTIVQLFSKHFSTMPLVLFLNISPIIMMLSNFQTANSNYSFKNCATSMNRQFFDYFCNYHKINKTLSNPWHFGQMPNFLRDKEKKVWKINVLHFSFASKMFQEIAVIKFDFLRLFVIIKNLRIIFIFATFKLKKVIWNRILLKFHCHALKGLLYIAKHLDNNGWGSCSWTLCQCSYQDLKPIPYMRTLFKS